MGCCLSCWRRCTERNYEELDESKEGIQTMDKSKLHAIEDESNTLLQDPAIQKVLKENDSDITPMDDDEMEKYIQNLEA